jgi:hypothetical protein
MNTQNQKINRITFAIDVSGSMRPIMKNAINAFNDNLKAVRQMVKETGQDATVTLITFDDKIQTKFFNRSIDSVKELGEADLAAGGQTALFDATELAIRQLQDLEVGSNEDVSYLVNIITDGEENASRTSSNKLNELMRKVQATDIWTLTFLVPRGGRYTLSRFGVPDGNVMEWTATAAGVKASADATQAGIKRFFDARASGLRSVKSFYTDLTNVSLKEVRDLDDLSRQAEILTVTHDTNIKDFIEGLGKTFIKGAAFYQLIGKKDSADKVQNYKQVLIMEKGKQKIYGGDDARQLLGLPDYETKVRPGDHGNFDIFIQSTSTNRKLKCGTKVIYMPSAAV